MVSNALQHFDIVINGGGLVGNSLALALAKTPYKIAIIEPFPLSNPKRSILESRTIAISHGAKRIYEGLQVWPALAPFASLIEHIHVSEQGRFGLTHIHARDQQMPALGYVLQITEVNRTLQQHIQTFPNIQIFCPAQIDKAELTGTSVSKQWQIKVRQQDNVTSISTDLLIAADGAQSQLRQQLGLQLQEKDYHQTALVGTVELTRAHDNTAYERFTADGPLALLPLQQQFCAVVLTVVNKDVAKWQAYSNAEFLAHLQQRFGYRLGRFKQVGPRVAYPLKLISAPKQSLSQFLLIGNAAHTLHPIAAQSFNLSLRDVALLAEFIAQAHKENTSLASDTLLTTYLQQRERDQHRTIKFTDGLIEIFNNSALLLPRNLAMTGLDMLPPVKTLLGKWGAGSLGKLSRLARGLPL